MIILPSMRGVIRRAPVVAGISGYVGVNVFPAATGSFSITKPVGTTTNDFMMIFCPYGGVVSSPGGAWINDLHTWSYSYDIHCYKRLLTSSDISGTISITGVNYAPVTCVVYRGPTSAVEMGYAESAGGDTTLSLTRTSRAGNSLGQVTWLSDRSGDGSPIPPTGFTARTGPNATGTFTGSIADRIDGTQPVGSGSDVWTNCSITSSYTQVGFNYELRA